MKTIIQITNNTLFNNNFFSYLVELDKRGIVSFTHYFQCNSTTSSKCSTWVKYLVKLACEANSEEENATLHYLLCSIINIGYGTLPPDIQNSIGGQTPKNACLIMTTMTGKLWEFLWTNPETNVNVFEVPTDSKHSCSHFQLAAFQKCYLELLANLISYKPETKANVAISSQHEWSFFKSPHNVTHFITQVF